MEKISLNINTKVKSSVEINPTEVKLLDDGKTISLKVEKPEHFQYGEKIIVEEYYGDRTEETENEYYCENGKMSGRTVTVKTNETLRNIYEFTVTLIFDGKINIFSDSDFSPIIDFRNHGIYDIRDENPRHYVRYYVDKSYYSVGMFISENESFKGYGNEDRVSMIMSNAKAELIPETIDVERVKCCPVFYTESGFTYADKIVFQASFYSGDTDSKGTKPTLLGKLGFVDGDVFYRKKKLSKSFIRLTYTESNELVSNMILNYSTIFYDCGKLFEDYIAIDREKAYNLKEDGDKKHVLSDGTQDGKHRLDSTFMTADEYDEKISSDGFNLYLFNSDLPEENEEKTIYLKIEYNDAGKGKTTPLLITKEYEKTLDDYKNDLYYKLIIKNIGGKYIYGFSTDENPRHSDCIRFEDGTIYVKLKKVSFKNGNDS